ncbi:MAG: hypothetical protein ACOX87_00815 [Chloroflexota bacterium]|jgi:hypothetical protein
MRLARFAIAMKGYSVKAVLSIVLTAKGTRYLRGEATIPKLVGFVREPRAETALLAPTIGFTNFGTVSRRSRDAWLA